MHLAIIFQISDDNSQLLIKFKQQPLKKTFIVLKNLKSLDLKKINLKINQKINLKIKLKNKLKIKLEIKFKNQPQKN